MKMHTAYTLAIITIAWLCLCDIHPTLARPYKDSPIKTIIVPYYSSNSLPVGYPVQPYQYPKQVSGEARHVLVPETMDYVPRFNLQPNAMTMAGNLNGMPLNFADGAYPVYYMPGNANGRFNGKISLLV